MIVTTVTAGGLKAVLGALGEAGAGKIGQYSHCSFALKGVGRFRACEGAQPHVGLVGEEINEEEEYRLETFCPRIEAKKVVEAIKRAHPYEEPVIYIIPLLSIDIL